MAFATGSSFLGGMSVHSEVGIEFTKRSSLHQREYQKRIMQYEKEFNINLTRISSTEREIQQSMLAYTDRVRTVQRRRYPPPTDPLKDANALQIRARHIPRSVHLPKLTTSRRTTPKKQSKGNKPRDKENRESNSGGSSDDGDVSLVRQTFPPTSFPKRGSPSKEQLKMNLASAADLCELTEYRLSRRGQGHGIAAFAGPSGKGGFYHASTDINNNDSREEDKEKRNIENENGKIKAPNLTVKEAVSQLDNKTMVKAIVKLRQIDRKLSQSSFNSRKYKKVKFRKPMLMAIPETESGDEHDDTETEEYSPDESSQRLSSDRSPSTPLSSQVSPLPVIPEMEQTTNHSNNCSDDDIGAAETQTIFTEDTANESEEIFPQSDITDRSRELSNFERARKQMRQKTKNKKLRFLKAV